MEEFTCPICIKKIHSLPDGKLRYCECGYLGVDKTKEYVRFLGVLPMESSSFPAYYEKTKQTIIEIQKQLGYKND